jgi:citrate synthase
MAESGKGLEGVVAAETALSDIDGKEGILWYVGFDINDLVNATFEEIIYLLHNLELPTSSQLDELKELLESERGPRPPEIPRGRRRPTRPCTARRYDCVPSSPRWSLTINGCGPISPRSSRMRACPTQLTFYGC